MPGIFRLSLLVGATSALSIVGTLVMTNDRLEREQRLREQSAAEIQRMQQKLAAVSLHLKDEKQDREDHHCEASEIEGDGQHGRATTSSLDDTMDQDAAVRLSTSDPTPWDTLRAERQQTERSNSDIDSQARSVARLLDLDSEQDAYYEDLVSEFEGRVDALYDRVAEQYEYSGQDPLEFQDMLQEIEVEKAELDALLDQELTRVLSDEQAVRYLALPNEERGVGPNAGLSRLDLQVFDLPFIFNSSSADATD